MTSRLDMLWGARVDYELVVPPLAARRPIDASAAFHLELLRSLVRGCPGNASLLRRVLEARFPRYMLETDEELVAVAADLIAHGELELREHPRPELGTDTNARTPRESPGIPLRSLAKDRQAEPPPTTFVAYIVVDQHGRPLAGHFHCRIDGKPHDGELAGDVVEFTEIRLRAQADVSFTELRMPEDGDAP